MTTKTPISRATSAPQPAAPAQRGTPRATLIAGGFYLVMGGIHVGIVAVDPETYRPFADGALFDFVRAGWSDVFMAHPTIWGLLLATSEIILGALLMAGGRSARWAWAAIAAFQVLLMLFGWGFWLWSAPALVVIYLGARRDWAELH